MPGLNDLREQRISLALQMRTLVDGDWTAQDEERFGKLDLELNAMDRKIDAVERADRVSAEHSAIRGEIVAQGENRTEVRGDPSPPEQRQALLAYLRGTTDTLTPELRRWTSRRVAEGRAQSVGTTTAGGFLVNYEFGQQIEAARRAYGAMLSVSTIYPTSSGAALLLPTVDETGVSGSILSENASISESAMTFAQTSVPSYMYTSGLVLISYQLLQDSEFPLDAFIADALGTRLGRAQNAHWTTGTGSSQPSGVVTGAAAGVTGATGSTITCTYNNIVDLIYSVDPAYRTNAKFMMNDTAIAVLRKLVDSQNRPLWEPAVQMGQPDMIFGYPIVTNQQVAVMAASAKSILFGDFSRYVIRDVSGVQIVRLEERYADSLQVGFYCFQRTGGTLLTPNTTTYNPVKYFANSAS